MTIGIPFACIAYVFGAAVGCYLGVQWERLRWLPDDE